MKCAQTGKVFLTKVCNLSKEDESDCLTAEDLTPGAGLLCDVKGKTYPIEVVAFQGKPYKHAHALYLYLRRTIKMVAILQVIQDKK